MYHNVAYTLIALEQAIQEPEALNDEDKKYLKSLQSALLHLNFAELKLRTLYEDEKKNHQDSTLNRSLAGMSKENPKWNGSDNRDFIGSQLLIAFDRLSMEYCHKEFQEIFEKELMVTSGSVIEHIENENKIERKKNSSKGGQTTKETKLKFLNHVLIQAELFCKKSSNKKLTIDLVSSHIHDEIIKIIQSDKCLMKQYPINTQGENDSEPKKRTISNALSELIKQGKLTLNSKK